MSSTVRRYGDGTLVTLIGAGIVNLITALWLGRAGYRVVVHDAAPDPRSGRHWTAYGCTYGGGNARMYTATEADDYHDHGAGAGRGVEFRHPLTKGGARSRDPRAAAEHRWIREHSAVTPDAARTVTADVYRLNQEAGRCWDELAGTDAALFDGAGRRDGILRLHTDTATLSRDVTRQESLGVLHGVLGAAEIAHRHPPFADAVRTGLLAGGLEVRGFTVQVHDFVRNLVVALEAEGVTFHWNHRIEAIRWDGRGRADGLSAESGIVRSDHYVISPGAYGRDLLRGAACHGLIQGVLGVWLALPDVPRGLPKPVKLCRTGHVAADSNITPTRGPRGERLLVIGSGYGWTGLDPAGADPGELDFLYRAVEDTVRRFLPRCHRAASTIETTRRLCVRPWTAAGLGVFERIPTTEGGQLIITGGHNTGGFAQAPAVANAVLAALRGRHHAMHELYHPARLRRIAVASDVEVPGADHRGR